MSKMLLQPNYCSCTVHQARNLPDKGKSGGINAFCTISMGKEKFVTAVREKTRTAEWQEQCDMAIVDDATIKLTVYHNTKNALSKGDFVGRAYVSLRDLPDYDHVHRSWYRLTNKEGKNDKDRGEIEVSLQFYSKNNTTGSVLDLATKKKHLSLKDIKHSLGGKLKSASKQRKQENNVGDNQLAEQRRRLGGADDSTYNVRDFLDDSASESTSFAGSHMSLNSMSYIQNAESQQKKMPRAPSSGLGSTLGTGTPHSSRRSVTSDYDTSSILDSASMNGGEEPSTPSPPIRSQMQQQQQQQQQPQQHREVYVGDDLPPRSNSTRKKSKEPAPSTTMPTIVTTRPQNNSPPLAQLDRNRSLSITGDDVEAAFDAVNDYKPTVYESSISKSKDYELSSPDSLFGLSTIKEATDTDEILIGSTSSKQQHDEMDEIDFDNCFNKYKEQKQQFQQQREQNQTKTFEEKPTKRSAPSVPIVEETEKKQEPKSVRSTKESKRTAPNHPDEIRTPPVSISTPKIEIIPTPKIETIPSPKTEIIPTSTATISNSLDDSNDSVDEDVDELLGKLERMSSIRSSVKRKIQPKDDIMQQSFSELDSPVTNKFPTGFTQNQSLYGNRTDRNNGTTLPDIVGEQSIKNSRQGTSQGQSSSSISNNKKANDNGLCVLGYENVKGTPVHPKIRQELDYLDREELLHVIAYQTDLLKKRDTRLKDLENYTDTLLVKILEQCPTILQNGTLKYNN